MKTIKVYLRKGKLTPVGYCYGVERALKLASEAINTQPQPIYTLGPIIHNPIVVAQFREKGISPVTDVKQVQSGTIIIRTHGVGPKVIMQAKKQGLNVIDATCPFVAKAQQKARQLQTEGYQVLIIGEKKHPEVISILAYTDDQALVVETEADLKAVKKRAKIGVVVQTTQSEEKLSACVAKLALKAKELKVFNTICSATVLRQKAAYKLAQDVEVMLVVGGKNSANTNRLAQICQQAGAKTYLVETAADLRKSWFKGITSVGVTSGASTPDFLLAEVVAAVKEIGS